MNNIIKSFYLSPYGNILSFFGNLVAFLHKPFMVYGFFDPAKKVFRKFTRISSSVTIMNREKLAISDNVWIWHYAIIDATEGIEIDEGVQIGAYVGIFTHGSENSIRLLGRSFIEIPNNERKGYTRGKIKIGKYTFIGAGSTVLPGVTIGKGCLIGAGTVVNKDIPDYSIALGSPAQVKGSTLTLDKRLIRQGDFSETYYDSETFQTISEVATRVPKEESK